MSTLTLQDRVMAGLTWPMLSLNLFKAGSGMAKANPKGTSHQWGLELEYAAAIAPAGGGVITLLMGGDVPLESMVMFYVTAATMSAFLDKIVGLFTSNTFAIGAIRTAMAPDPSGGSGPDIAFNVAGPTTAHPLNTANTAQSKFALPRYPFISGQQYALHNDGGTTWATTKQAVHGGF